MKMEKDEIKLIKLDRQMRDAIYKWCEACKKHGLGKDDIETALIVAAEIATDDFIELSR